MRARSHSSGSLSPARHGGRRLARCARVAAVATAFLAGCATATQAPASPTPDQIPALQARLASDSTPRTRVLLAAAYRAAGKPEQALALLEPLVAADPRDAAANFYLGLTYEDLKRYGDARRVYTTYLASGRSPELKQEVQDRLALVDREELQQAVQSAVANEAQLRSTPPTPRTIAVFPFLNAGGSQQLNPLSRALAELLSSDLGQTDRLRVLERSRVQYLIDEIKLGQSGLVQASTAARAGHLLGASRIVEGRVGPTPQQLDLAAVVVPVGGAAADTSLGSPLQERGSLPQLLDMEKQLALGVYDRLGIQLTVAERERVTAKATSNVQALLAFGFGLESEDAGRYEEAARQYQRAIALDPGFILARQHLTTVQQLARATTHSETQLADMGMTELQPPRPALPLGMLHSAPIIGPGTTSTVERLSGFDMLIASVPDPEFRDPASEAFGLEGLVPQATLQLILRIK
jgi:tetratricopeptide (TPR) repeat protein